MKLAPLFGDESESFISGSDQQTMLRAKEGKIFLIFSYRLFFVAQTRQTKANHRRECKASDNQKKES
jgi:hypothetical protein